MEIENTEEEVLNQDTQPTDDELYDAEYDKAWTGEEEPLEQPNEEPETTDEIVEEEVEEDSKKEVIADEDTPVEESDKEETPVDDFAKVLKWNKKEIPVTEEELIALAQKGFDSEKKWQEAAVNRPIKEVIDKYGLTVEQLTMLGNISKDKNPEALALLAELNGIDMFEAEKKDYQPVVESKNYELEDVITEINKNEEVATQMNDYISSVPQAVKDTLTQNPDVLRGLNTDMVNGIAQQVMPEVIKQLAINPRQDFVSVYREVGQRIMSQEAPQKEVAEPKPVATRDDKRRVAVSSKNSAPKKAIADDYDATWDDDKHFNDVLSRLQGF